MTLTDKYRINERFVGVETAKNYYGFLQLKICQKQTRVHLDREYPEVLAHLLIFQSVCSCNLLRKDLTEEKSIKQFFKIISYKVQFLKVNFPKCILF
jgi:hypothetical protein